MIWGEVEERGAYVSGLLVILCNTASDATHCITANI